MAGGLATYDASGRRDTTDAASHSDSDMAGAPGGKAEDADLSPEDAAWVDSCLVKDNHDHDGGVGKGDYLSDDAWAALTQAFVAALAYSASGAVATFQDQHKVGESSSSSSPIEASRANASGEEVEELMPQAASPATDGLVSQADAALTSEPSSPTASAYAASFYDQPSLSLGGGSSSGDAPWSTVAVQSQGTAEASSSGRLDSVAVVIGNEYPEPEEEGYGGDGDDDEFSIAAGVEEVELTRDVFRVWELDVADGEEEEEEEEEFGWQLKKALEEAAGGGVSAVMPPLADEEASVARILVDEWKMHEKPSAVVLDDQNLEELIAGINDMSLGRPSSDSS